MSGDHEREADGERGDTAHRVNAEAGDDGDFRNGRHAKVPLSRCCDRANPVLDDEADAHGGDKGGHGPAAFESSEDELLEENADEPKDDKGENRAPDEIKAAQ